jgi:hypothetical protein
MKVEGIVIDNECIVIEAMFNNVIDDTIEIQAIEEKVIIEYVKE